MKAVDFIIELSHKSIYLEIKDPDVAGATVERRKQFHDDLQSARLDQSLKYKLRDSFLYEWACRRTTKPIVFVVLIQLASLTSADLGARADALKGKLPVKSAAPSQWRRYFVDDCLVMNMETWNRRFSNYPIQRI